MNSAKRPWGAKQKQSQQSQSQSQRHFYNWELSHSLGAPQHQTPPYLMQSTGRKAPQNDYGRLLF
ncbi:GD25658 [Drosophila simulans]|nr:GD25658 [Drosophila simulans]